MTRFVDLRFVFVDEAEAGESPHYKCSEIVRLETNVPAEAFEKIWYDWVNSDYGPTETMLEILEAMTTGRSD